jgi:hypothetical protein
MMTTAVFGLIIAALAFGGLCAWLRPFTVSLAAYERGLHIGAVLGCIYGVITIGRIVVNLTSARAEWSGFQNELMGYILFWVFVPPLWFFLEYYAFDNGFIVDPAMAQPGNNRLQKIKDYADYASKIWLALAGLLVAVAAFKQG